MSELGPLDGVGTHAAHLDDARRLLLSMAHGQGGDHGHERIAGLSVSTLSGSRWGNPVPAEVTVTETKLMVTFSTRKGTAGVTLPWSAVAAFQADLGRASVTLEGGDGQRLAFSGPSTPLLAVIAVARLYGPNELLLHPALRPLRRELSALGTPR